MAHRGHAVGVVLTFVLSGAAGGCGGSSPGASNPGGPGSDGGTPATGGGSLGNCPIFPADNPWNTDISGDAVDPNSAAYIAHMNGGSKLLHPDFGSSPDYGIPYITVGKDQPRVPMTFDYKDESDPGPYPYPPNAPIEGGSCGCGDQHVLVIDRDACILYETFASKPTGPGWACGAGAIFDLRSNKLRTDGFTSADAAGLPIFPGLARYDEAVTAGEIKHALRFTAASTQNSFVHPATHGASNVTAADAPPMGLRVRLKASYDLSKVTGASKVILTALKKYGMFLADNGSDWYVSGVTDPKWNDDDLNQIKKVPASAFEVVKLGTITKQP